MSKKSPASIVPINPDPVHSGSLIRKAFLAESLANLMTVPLLTHTRTVLSYLLARPSDINPSSLLFSRLFAAIVLGALTPALWFGTANTRSGVESRKPVYILLGGGEMIMIPVLIREALKGGDRTAALNPMAAWGAVAMIAPPLAWRFFVLFAKPELMGKYTEKRE